MTDLTDISADEQAEAELALAIETLTTRLEAEQTQAEVYRAKLQKCEQRSERLQTSIEAAIHLLPRQERRRMQIQLYRKRLTSTKPGRPVREGRQTALLHFLAERGSGTISSAEIRDQLNSRGMRATPQYVSGRLTSWVREGLVSRVRHGLYRINEQAATLRNIRLRQQQSDTVDDLRARTAEMQGMMTDAGWQ